MSESPRVIVFGPTGNVGSATARTAASHGAKVFLAMRDTQKAIPGLTTEQHKHGNYERVQADLTDPATIENAVRAAKAKHAFIYRARTTTDHMRSAIQALKSAGVEFVVFLSSSTIRGEPGDVQPKDLIAYLHAQVEMQLEEMFPGRYVTIRPGRFATNMLRFKDGIVAGEVRLFTPKFVQDMITPEDMGGVSGTILVRGVQDGEKRVELYGPQLYTQQEATEFIGKQLNKDIKIVDIDEREAMETYTKSGTSKPVAEYMVNTLKNAKDDEFLDQARYKAGVNNVERYTGRPAMGFKEWVDLNRGAFEA